ncbi:MAG: cadherin-like beta sandwich domain-containing protein [Rufibacter sp.]
MLFLALLLTCLSGLAFAQQANHLVISEVYGGAGNPNAPFKSDYIEIYNPTGEAVSVNGWSLQYASTTGTTWTKAALPDVSIPAKSYLLLKGFTGNGIADLPGADATVAGVSISASGGKVALVSNNTALTGSNPTGTQIIDRLGWGSANASETATAPATATTTSVERKANHYSTETTMAPGGSDAAMGNGFDSDDNSFDFVVAVTPNPQFSGSATETMTATVPAPTVPALGNTVATQIKAKSVVLNGVITSNGGAKIIERGVVYVASTTEVVPTIGTTGHTKQNSTTTGTGSFSETVTGLTPETKYYARTFATNASGTEYGSVTEFTTANLYSLSSLYLTSGTLTPTVHPATLAYTATVDNFTTSVNLVPVVSEPGATVKVNGVEVASGNASSNLPLSYGANTVTVLVTAADASASTIYTITITRETTSATRGIANHLVISELYAGAGNNGPYAHDFVELYNPTNSAISVAGWSVQVAAPDGTSWIKTNLPAKTIPAKSYFLIQGAAGAGTTTITTFDDNLSSLSMSPTGGKAILVNNNVAVAEANPTGAHIIDKIGWGSTPAPTGFEGAYAPAFTEATSLERKATSYSTAATMAADGADAAKGNGFDSNDNSFDFIIAAVPTPEHMSSALADPGTVPAPVAPTVSTAAASGISTSTATVGGDVTDMGGAKIEERGILYLASNTAVVPTIGLQGVTKKMNATATTGSFSEDLANLSTNTKYYVRAYATNVAGTAYGETVEFTTLASANADLSNLALSDGSLTPTFATETTSYSAIVPFSSSSITVTPTVADPTATVTVNGVAVASGSASAAIPLTVGTNTLTTVVTAANGAISRTYTVTVERLSSKSAGNIANYVVISEVSGGGGNASAPYQSDYVELYNPTNSDIVMTDWSVQHAASDGTTWTKAVFSGTIKAKGYFLIRGYTGAGLAPLDNYDATVTGTSTLSISAIRAKVVLVNNSTTVTGANPTGDEIIDKLGWGSTGAIPTGYEETPAVNTSTTTTIHRKAHANATATSMAAGGTDADKGNGYDSDNNFYDFIVAAPNPQWSGSATESLGSTSAVQAPLVSTTPASVIMATSATVGGNVTSDGGTSLTEIGIVYVASQTDVEPAIGTTGHTKIAATTAARGAFTESLTGLTPKTKYYARAYATNAQGTSYGAVESFTTTGTAMADLSGLALSAGTLTPAFSAATLNYTAMVDHTVSGITVTPTLADANATVTINGTAVANGNASASIALETGDNTITTVVTAQDGTTTKTYTLVVTKSTTTSTADELTGIPSGVVISSVFPNPMQTEGSVRFGLPKASQVHVQVFTMAGVKVLEKSLGSYGSGYHLSSWFTAGELPAGAYILRLVANNGTATTRVVVAR